MSHDSVILNMAQEDSVVPLQTSWTFWSDKYERGFTAAEFQANLKQIYEVKTVQSFWSVYNNIPEVNELTNHHSYHLMREDRKPLWEDEKNRCGGSWRMKVYHKDAPKIWKELLLAAIGEQLSDHVSKGDEICGITINVRDKDDVVQIWNTNASLATTATVPSAIKKLLPDVTFLSEFYKANYTHQAYEGKRI